jgi:hypothetical protein
MQFDVGIALQPLSRNMDMLSCVHVMACLRYELCRKSNTFNEEGPS